MSSPHGFNDSIDWDNSRDEGVNYFNTPHSAHLNFTQYYSACDDTSNYSTAYTTAITTTAFTSTALQQTQLPPHNFDLSEYISLSDSDLQSFFPEPSFNPEQLYDLINSPASPMDPGMSVSSSLSNSLDVTPAIGPVSDLPSPTAFGLELNLFNYSTAPTDQGLLSISTQEDYTLLPTTTSSFNYQSLSSNPTAFPSPANYAHSPGSYAHSPANYPSPQAYQTPSNPHSPSASAGPSSPSKSTGLYCSHPSCSHRKPFPRKCDLNKHEKTHAKNLACPFADVGCSAPLFSSEKDRRRHIAAKHDGTRPYQCMECKELGTMKFFNRKDNMRDHQRRVHSEQGPSSS